MAPAPPFAVFNIPKKIVKRWLRRGICLHTDISEKTLFKRENRKGEGKGREGREKRGPKGEAIERLPFFAPRLSDSTNYCSIHRVEL